MTDEPDPRLEAYLDDALADDERTGFERAVDDDEHLASALDLQQRIDDSLRRVFDPPIVRPTLETPPRAPRRPWASPLRRLAIAACFAGAIIGTWSIWRSLAPPPAGEYDQAWRSFETGYRDTVDAGFRPAWTCRDDAEFVETFRQRFRQALVLDAGTNVTALGLAYCNSLSPRTLCLLATADDAPVLVFVDRIERDHPAVPSAGLHLFRTTLGDIALYELTPLEYAAVLPGFSNPDQPDARTGPITRIGPDEAGG